MDSQTRDSFLYSQLVPLAKWSDTTTLMMNPGTKTLYIAKEIDAAAVPRYRLLTGLCGEGLPVIRAVVEHDGGATVLREYLSGTSLAAMLNGGRTVPRDIAVRYVTELCDGLSVLHRAGLVHRDINPNNISSSRPTGTPKSLISVFPAPSPGRKQATPRFSAPPAMPRRNSSALPKVTRTPICTPSAFF